MGSYVTIFFAILRIVATFGVFVFHFFSLIKFDNKYIDYFSILIFCFISGYFSFNSDNDHLGWFIRRISSIIIPYWLVIIPIVVANKLFHYKETSIFSDIITILFGNLFLDNPIYVLSWYITFINMIYIFVFFVKISNFKPVTFFIWIIGCLFFCFYLNVSSYFISFSSGCLFSKIVNRDSWNTHYINNFVKFLFFVHDKTYAFFLVHGAILLLFSNIMGATGCVLFMLSLMSSFGLAIILRNITRPLVIRVSDRVLHISRQFIATRITKQKI